MKRKQQGKGKEKKKLTIFKTWSKVEEAGEQKQIILRNAWLQCQVEIFQDKQDRGIFLPVNIRVERD